MSIFVSKLIRKCQAIKGPQKGVLVTIAEFAEHDGTNAYPSLSKIARASGYARSTVAVALIALKAKGYLKVAVKGGAKGWQPNNYSINVTALQAMVNDHKRPLDHTATIVDNFVHKEAFSVDNPVDKCQNNDVSSPGAALVSSPADGLEVVREPDTNKSLKSINKSFFLKGDPTDTEFLKRAAWVRAALKSCRIPKQVANEWIRRHGVEAIQQRIELIESQGCLIPEPGKALARAIDLLTN